MTAMVIWIHESCGVFCMLNYTSTIFAEAGAVIDPNQAAIVVATLQFVGNYVSTLLVDRAGRKVRKSDILEAKV